MLIIHYIFNHYQYKNASPLFKKYFIIFKILDYIIKKSRHNIYHYSHLGRKPYSRLAIIKAFIIKHLEGFKFVSDIIRLLKDNPQIASLCGFHYSIPDDSVFYRFLNSANHKILYSLFHDIVHILIKNNIISTSILSIDSKPVKAYTKFNNFKFFDPASVTSSKELAKSDRNYQAILSYYSKNLTSRKNSFFWGYKLHCITSPEGIPIAFHIAKNKIPDHKVANKLIKKIKQFNPNLNIKHVLADAAYDNNYFYNLVFKELKAFAVTPKNKRNSLHHSDDYNSYLCPAGLKMKFNGFVKERNRCRIKFRCPIKIANKKEAKKLPNICPINHPKFSTGKKYGCVRYFNPDSLIRNSFQSSFLSQIFYSTYKKRKSVELYFARLHNLNIENQTHFFLKSIRNYVCIANIAQVLIALAAGVVLKDITAIRKYKNFAQNAPPPDKLKIKLAA